MTTDRAPDSIIAYKGFDAQFRCRDHQYAVGATYEFDGAPMLCHRGFHACQNPLDVWRYYPVVLVEFHYGPLQLTRYAKVRLSGTLDIGDDKIAATRIAIDAEITLGDLIDSAVRWMQSATGPTLHDGDALGNRARIKSSSDNVQIGAWRNDAHIAASGKCARIAASGDDARIGASGNGARIAATGHDPVVACVGQGDSVICLGPGGCAAVAYHDGTRTRFAVAYVGEGGIEAGVTYRVTKRGEFERVETAR